VKSTTLLLALLLASPAMSDVLVEFDEGAPKDRFTVSNSGDCPLGPMRVVIDISTAPAGLIFDVTGAGAGVEVFQPFELVSGKELLTSEPSVSDGQTSVALDLSGLPTGQAVAFTIDVDDTTSDRQITVSGSEMSGAQVRIEAGNAAHSGVFDARALATVPLSECTS